MLFHWQRWAQDQAFLVGIILPLWTQCFCTTSPRPHGRSLGVFFESCWLVRDSDWTLS